jgi:hypothetical protein
MIELSFELYLPSNEREAEGRQSFSDKAIYTNLLYGELTFTVNGVNLAWKGVVPILDVARQLFWAVDRLSARKPEQVVQLLDYYEVIRLKLVGSYISLNSEYTHGIAQCEFDELRKSIYDFGMKALHACIDRFPEAATSPELRENFPFRLDAQAP